MFEETCDFIFESVHVFLEFETAFGFEALCNIIREDGFHEKQARQVLMSDKIENIAVAWDRMSDGMPFAYIVVAS